MVVLDCIIKELSGLKNEAYDNGFTVSGKAYKEAIHVVKKWRRIQQNEQQEKDKA